MTAISINNLSFAYGGADNIFENVSLTLNSSWKLGLIGRNGRGKTTFLKLLQGKLDFTGSINCPLNVEYFPFAVQGEHENALELALSFSGGAQEWQLERELAFLDVTPAVLGRPFATLSGGEATKLLLAAMFLREGSFFLIDEPTNHLDVKGRQVLGQYLRRKSGFILVSHDRALLDTCIDHVLAINRANIELQKGNYSSWQLNFERQAKFETETNNKLKKDIARLEQAAQRVANWAGRAENEKVGIAAQQHDFVERGYLGHKAAKMMKRSKAVQARRDEAVKEKAQLLRNVESAAALNMRPLTFHNKHFVELCEAGVSYNGQPVVGPLSFTLAQGERVALTGSNGSGKSSVLKLVLGQEKPAFGTVHVAQGLRISYVPQNTSLLCGALKDFARESKIDENLLRAVLHRLGFERSRFYDDMSALSAGQKKKVLLGASLCTEAHLYLWDEPFNYIDIMSREQIEDLIVKSNPTMLFVEHDAVFTKNIATRVIEL